MRAAIPKSAEAQLGPDKAKVAKDLLKGMRLRDSGTNLRRYQLKRNFHTIDYDRKVSFVGPSTSRRQVVTGTLYYDGTKIATATDAAAPASRLICAALAAGTIPMAHFAVLPTTTPGDPIPPRKAPLSADPKPKAPPPPKQIIIEQDHVIIHGIRLRRYPTPGPLTPTKDEIDELHGLDKELRSIAVAISRRMPVLLEGDTGTGKTSIIAWLAHLCNVNLLKIVGDPEYGPSLWTGHLHAKNGTTYWVDGDLPSAMRGIEGKGQTWLLVDEINRMLPDNTAPLMPVIERRGGHLGALRLTDNPDPAGRIVKPHADFWVAAAMNPNDGDFAGTHELDRALERRFPVRLHFDYPAPAAQAHILRNKFPGVQSSIIARVVDVATTLRNDRRSRRISFPCSPDVLETWIELAQDLGMKDAGAIAITNKAAPEDRKRVEELLATKIR